MADETKTVDTDQVKKESETAKGEPKTPKEDPETAGKPEVEEATSTDESPDEVSEDTETEASEDEPVADSYVVLCTVLGGFGYEHGWLVFEDELGGPDNVKRLLDNRSIAVSTSDEGRQAHQEHHIAAQAVRNAKERGG